MKVQGKKMEKMEEGRDEEEDVKYLECSSHKMRQRVW